MADTEEGACYAERCPRDTFCARHVEYQPNGYDGHDYRIYKPKSWLLPISAETQGSENAQG